jgi:UTP--glucose-1-phosphate uridylyltransferase
VSRVRKAVLPVAGLGTRFLPATKAIPKEMLTLVDKPLIQYAVEEAVESGIRDIILVSGPGKDSLEDHFDHDPELIRELEARGKTQEAESLRALSQLANVVSVRQKKPLGLGHAVGCARDWVGREPFAVLLPDDLVDAPVPCTRQLLEVQEAQGGSVIATRAVDAPALERYGVMKVEPVESPRWPERLFRVTDLVEKPRAADAPSPYVVIGRYILEPEIFDRIDATPPGRDGEIQLTDALRGLARERRLHAFLFEGIHQEAGERLGFLRSTLYYGLKHPELGPPLREYLKSLKL